MKKIRIRFIQGTRIYMVEERKRFLFIPFWMEYYFAFSLEEALDVVHSCIEEGYQYVGFYID